MFFFFFLTRRILLLLFCTAPRTGIMRTRFVFTQYDGDEHSCAQPNNDRPCVSSPSALPAYIQGVSSLPFGSAKPCRPAAFDGGIVPIRFLRTPKRPSVYRGFFRGFFIFFFATYGRPSSRIRVADGRRWFPVATFTRFQRPVVTRFLSKDQQTNLSGVVI